jgi:hypothetical protein
MGSGIFTHEVTKMVRLTPGGGPGSWFVAAFLPLAAIIAFGLVGSPFRDKAVRAMVMALTGLAGVALSGLGFLPPSLANAPAYLSLTAVSASLLVAYGLASVMTGLGGEAFGLRQVATALLTAVLAAGIALQAMASMIGGWAVGGPAQVPAAWAVVAGPQSDAFRVLWVGRDHGAPFPYPGGEPAGVIDAAGMSLRFAVTGPEGTTSLDIGRPLAGPGADRFGPAMQEILSGSTVHGGALLAPFAVRFIVAADGDLPSGAANRFGAQVDFDLVPATGLVIYRNAAALPPASVIPVDDEDRRLVLSDDPGDTILLRPQPVLPMLRAPGGWEGVATTPSLAVLSTEYDPAWALEGSNELPRRAFGWATALDAPPGSVDIRYGAQLPRSVEVVLLAALWIAALWITRKPVAR